MTTLHDNTQTQPASTETKSLRQHVKDAMLRYFDQLGGTEPANLYEMVLNEIEAPFLEAVMQFTRGNQSRAARILGLSRGTLRKKLKQYDLL
ncbi:MAG: DNA-binding protein Fis [marine bacterium B5-7]|nr:MAG: DNA-binding protein Fis [marine bacterium B5-7]